MQFNIMGGGCLTLCRGYSLHILSPDDSSEFWISEIQIDNECRSVTEMNIYTRRSCLDFIPFELQKKKKNVWEAGGSL